MFNKKFLYLSLIGFFVTTVVHPPVMASPGKEEEQEQGGRLSPLTKTNLVNQMESDTDSNEASSVAAFTSLDNLPPEMVLKISEYLTSEDTASLRLTNKHMGNTISGDTVQKKRENEQKRIKEFIEKTGFTDLNDKKFSEAIKTILKLRLQNFPLEKQVEVIRAIHELDPEVFEKFIAKTYLKDFYWPQNLEAIRAIKELDSAVFKEFMAKTYLKDFYWPQNLEAIRAIKELDSAVFKEFMAKTFLEDFYFTQHIEAIRAIHELDPAVFKEFMAKTYLKHFDSSKQVEAIRAIHELDPELYPHPKKLFKDYKKGWFKKMLARAFCMKKRQ